MIRHSIIRRIGIIISLALAAAPAWSAPAKSAPVPVPELPASLVRQVENARFRFGTELQAAYVAHARGEALAALRAAGKELPADFLAWVDADPLVSATVYGMRRDAAGVLAMLRSLEIDLGVKAVRQDHTQLALAMAVVHASQGAKADLTPRAQVRVIIPGDPRKPVDTKDPKRTLDMNDHVINFLNGHTLEEEVVVGHKEEPPPLKYDDKGIAIPPPKNAKKVKVPVTEKRVRTLYAADVIASRDWQVKFNAYMKAKGFPVDIDCGERVVHWKSTAAVREERKKINEAFLLFRAAYEAKGLLPAARDPGPSPAESVAYYIRNHKHVFPEETRAERKWPRFPLNAPWPTLTLLAADDQPLREREERWLAFRDKGEIRAYGEYIGPIAQQSDMQSARRVAPHPFTYGTYQMMAKDGGVCGTMANMGARTYRTLGIPSCTAGQPGHCALILFAHQPNNNTFDCKGGQFATGGPEQTTPHTPWVFGDVDARVRMIHYQCVAWAVNFGVQGFLDSTIAYQLFRGLPEPLKKEGGLDLLLSALPLNPYNILLTETALDHAARPEDIIRVCRSTEQALAAVNREGCPKDGYYLNHIRNRAYAKLARIPAPADLAAARAALAFLVDSKCADSEPLIHYQIALDGIEVVTGATRTALKAHLCSGARTDAECQRMAAGLNAVAARIPDKKHRAAWVADCWRETIGRETYPGRKDKITVDASVSALAKLAKAKLPPEPQIQQSALNQITAELRARLDAPRNAREAGRFAAKLTAVAGQVKDPAAARAWLGELAAAIKGRETFPAGKKTTRDPVADAIPKLLATLQEPQPTPAGQVKGG